MNHLSFIVTGSLTCETKLSLLSILTGGTTHTTRYQGFSQKILPSMAYGMIAPLRLNGFPRGLGKGHDAAVVGAWLGQEIRRISLDSIDICLHKFEHSNGFPPQTKVRYLALLL